MKIRIRRSGGLAGAEDEDLGVVDTGTLAAADASRLQDAAEDLARREGRAGDVGADLYEYRVDLITERGERTLRITDRGEPEEPVDPALAQLLRAVRSPGR